MFVNSEIKRKAKSLNFNLISFLVGDLKEVLGIWNTEKRIYQRVMKLNLIQAKNNLSVSIFSIVNQNVIDIL